MSKFIVVRLVDGNEMVIFDDKYYDSFLEYIGNGFDDIVIKASKVNNSIIHKVCFDDKDKLMKFINSIQPAKNKKEVNLKEYNCNLILRINQLINNNENIINSIKSTDKLNKQAKQDIINKCYSENEAYKKSIEIIKSLGGLYNA